MQLSGGDVSKHLCGAWHAADQCGNHDQQCHRKSVVLEQLLIAAIVVSDQLRADIAVAVIGRR
jgi:hypothetical protein